MKKIIFVVMLLISTSINAQIIQFEELGKYSRFGILIGGSLYDNATIKSEYGPLTFKNKLIPSYNLGFEYDFSPERKWSIITGFNCSFEPLYNLKVPFYTNDFDESKTDPDFIEDYAYSLFSFSTPILLAHREKFSNYSFLEFRVGFRLMYYSDGDIIYGYGYDDNNNHIEVFELRLRNTNTTNIYGSFVFGAGVNLLTKWFLMKINILCNLNFKNPIEGEYLFDNLPISERTYGKYYLSGNYLGLNVVFHFNRDIFKRKLKKSYTVNLPF